jgi:sugar-specific transcriptional regulator TrmB
MPPSSPQSALRAPLNTILGSEANVRVLRVLAMAETSLTAGELARRAVLGRTSVYPVLASLEDAGIVQFVGAGAQRQVNYRKAHPLAGPIAALFRAEAERVDALVAELRRAVESMERSPTAAWLEGEIVAGRDRMGDAITCMLLDDPASLSRQIDHLSQHLERIERKFGVHVEVRGITRSELAMRSPAQRKALENVILLCGVPPAGLLPQRARLRSGHSGSHGDLDARARRLGIAVAEKLKRDPGLTSLARQHLARRERKASPQERRELLEWARILATMSPSRLRRFLVEPSERATRLRQTLPALDLLTPGERDAALASTSDAEARAAVLGGRPGRAVS